MALTTVNIEGRFAVLTTATELQFVPAFMYEDGKKTNTRRTDSAGRELFSVRGALTVIEGEVVADGSIFIYSPQIPEEGSTLSTSVGKLLEVDGTFKVRAARGYGLTGTLEGSFVDGEKD